ncbi:MULTISPECIES: hypothetical protein [unclassified Burkholderia]|uniref:hypothetical protein n=1 Tax=unclassified Burkholderia TaxID=2613784 RepID=UPI000F561592|nr:MULTISPECIES: hypothetical protein [unclassified Burkholderia]
MSAYVKHLNRLAEASVPATQSLRQRFVDWYRTLPEISRCRAFSMIEFETALGTQGKYISPVLLELGWQRKRRWSSRGQYHRYWVPPQPGL